MHHFFNCSNGDDHNPLGNITRESIIDAYLGVSVFVSTLFVFYGAEKIFKIDINNLLKNNKKLQVPIASFLGMLPGCGGAIIVVSSYSAGNISFGAVVAALISNYG